MPDAAEPSKIELPPIPENQSHLAVAAWSEPLSIDSYLPEAPSEFPAYLDARVYQGSSGKVYPLPFHERISPAKSAHLWQAVHLENRWLRLVILPELGGRVHIAFDKVADYDIFYRNDVIKPALVGLAGPWISGGIEFNWPQHHRPGTFLPTDVEIERESDGAVTVWCSDHDPFARMKGMHGIRLRPDSAVIEARVRLYNRTDTTQTFLWWANVAAAVNDDYQSFFPTDVTHVADHAKRAVVGYPQVDGSYYGVDYPGRVDDEHPDADRLDWYRNIPVPTSYMITHTDADFFGGYDHRRKAGFVCWADHLVAPGKKLWTWGDDEFGHAWGANLTDSNGPYVELMAGAFTDNQPDFSFLTPGETKTFSQYWYPIHGIGPAHQATLDAAVRLDVVPGEPGTRVKIGVSGVHEHRACTVTLSGPDGEVLLRVIAPVSVENALIVTDTLPGLWSAADLTVTVAAEASTDESRQNAEGRTLVSFRHGPSVSVNPPDAAIEPPAPAEVETVEQLFLIGQYLDQYRHATRSPEPYLREALRRDPLDVRSNTALAARLIIRAEFAGAESLLRTALGRLLAWVPNPASGEAHYLLGLALAHQSKPADALSAFAKAAWNGAWRAAAHYAMAKLRAAAGETDLAEADLRTVLRADPEHTQAASLLVLVLRDLGRPDEADVLLEATRRRDPLDQWARHLGGATLSADAPTLLDVALDCAGAGHDAAALRLLSLAENEARTSALGQVQIAPLAAYHRAVILWRLGRDGEAEQALVEAREADGRFCLASRLADVATLRRVLERHPDDGRAGTLLANWYYDKGRHADAIGHWNAALAGRIDDRTAVIVHRNLAIAAHNVSHDRGLALVHMEGALALAPEDPQLWYELDQLCMRIGASGADRLARLDARPDIVARRDDLTVAYAELLIDAGQARRAKSLLAARRFQPWEGGEGMVLGTWDRSCLTLAQEALTAGLPEEAVELLGQALRHPDNLAEGRHPLSNSAELRLCLGDAWRQLGESKRADAEWRRAAAFTGDFVGMTNRSISSRTYFSTLALTRLGETAQARELTAEMAAFAAELSETVPVIDYFATSLPTMLLFHADLAEGRRAEIGLLTRQIAELTALLEG